MNRETLWFCSNRIPRLRSWLPMAFVFALATACGGGASTQVGTNTAESHLNSRPPQPFSSSEEAGAARNNVSGSAGSAHGALAPGWSRPGRLVRETAPGHEGDGGGILLASEILFEFVGELWLIDPTSGRAKGIENLGFDGMATGIVVEMVDIFGRILGADDEAQEGRGLGWCIHKAMDVGFDTLRWIWRSIQPHRWFPFREPDQRGTVLERFCPLDRSTSIRRETSSGLASLESSRCPERSPE